MLNIYLGDTVVTALAKYIFFYNSRKAYLLGTYGVIRVSALAKILFFGHFWQGLIFLVTAFFYRNDYVSDRQYILYKRAPASEECLYVV